MRQNRSSGLHLCCHADTDQEHTDHALRLAWIGPADPSPLDIAFFSPPPPEYEGPRPSRLRTTPTAVYSMGAFWPRRADGSLEPSAYGAVDRNEPLGGESAAAGGAAAVPHSPSASPLPSLFLPHGAPPIPIERCASEEWLRAAAASLPAPPRAILFMSPHFASHGAFAVSTTEQPETIYDFDADTDAGARPRPCRHLPTRGARACAASAARRSACPTPYSSAR